MYDALKNVPPWFLILVVIGLLAIAVRTIDYGIKRWDKSLDRFEAMMDKIFDKHEDHEARISRLEGEHYRNHP